MKQMTFASAAWSVKGNTTRRERFLAEMNVVIPWARLTALIEPHYPRAGNGRQPMPLERMLRVYFMQHWFNLSDPQAEDALYDIEPMRRFAGGPNCTAIKPIGVRITGRTASTRVSAIGSIAGPNPEPNSPHTRNRSTAAPRAAAPAASLPSMWLSACGALPR